MTYNYPYFSFPHFRRYPGYYPVQYPYVRQPVQTNKTNQTVQTSHINQNSYVRQPTSINQQVKKHLTGQINSQSNPSIDRNNINYTEGKKQYYKSNYVNKNEDKKERNYTKKTPSGFSFLNNFLHQEDRGEDEEYFELLGLKLYQDDLLLIGLIFFLYKEDVKDQYLFFALVLLLLS